MKRKKQLNLVIGVDGGGVKTVAALSDLKGKILSKARSGPSSFIKVGVKETILNITEAIEKILKKDKKGKILSTFIALAAVEENKEMGREIKRILSRQSKLSEIFKGKVVVGSDQIAAFRSATDKKEGVVLISGAGCSAHGWREKGEFKTSGWGYLNDEGSSFWIGQEGLRAANKDLDGRGPKTLIAKLIFRKLRIKNIEDLKKKVYTTDLIKTILSFSILVAKASKRNDRVAKNILIKAGNELALSANTVIKKLNFQKSRFPLVMVGGMFKSKFILDIVKREIKKVAPKVQFIQPKAEPVIGALKLARKKLPKDKVRELGVISKDLDSIIKIAKKSVKEGEIVICPTDTVYGLISDATNEKAVKKLFKMKKRLALKPVPIFVKDVKMAKKFAYINKNQEEFLKKVWPGKITVVLKRRKKKIKLFGVGKDTIALRIPKYKLINELLKKLNCPLTGTSANISGKPALTKIKTVTFQFKNQKFLPDLVLNGGNLRKSLPSTIIDLTKKEPKILRGGNNT